jgi:hypothetical protein
VAYSVPSDGQPLPGDYDSDGKTDLAVFRSAIGNWVIVESSSNFVTWHQDRYFAWAGDGVEMAADGDYNGDGRCDFGFFRPDLSLWRLWLRTPDPRPTEAIVPFGLVGDRPVIGDYDGDGTDDIALYRPETGDWYIATSSTNFAFYVAYHWGAFGDVPAIKP